MTQGYHDSISNCISATMLYGTRKWFDSVYMIASGYFLTEHCVWKLRASGFNLHLLILKWSAGSRKSCMQDYHNGKTTLINFKNRAFAGIQRNFFCYFSFFVTFLLPNQLAHLLLPSHLFQKWIQCGYCSTLWYSCSASLATCSSLWFWWWINECGQSPTPSSSLWLSVTWWWLCFACLSRSSQICWRTSSLELPCARLWLISWVGIQLILANNSLIQTQPNLLWFISSEKMVHLITVTLAICNTEIFGSEKATMKKYLYILVMWVCAYQCIW